MNVVNQPIVKHKFGLLNLAEELGNVSQAGKIMGVSRDTFYRYHEAKSQGGVEALLQKDRRKPNLNNRVDEVIEQAVLAYAMEEPAHGQTRANKSRRYGENMDCEPSRFLNELPEQHIERSGGGQKLDPEVSKARGRAHLAALKDLLG